MVGDGWLVLHGRNSLAPGLITFRRGYAWDGPSGPTIDTKNWMRASIVHDGFYQLMRESLLPQSFRKRADQIMHEMLRADGMSRARARMSYLGVRAFGARAARPQKPKPLEYAP